MKLIIMLICLSLVVSRLLKRKKAKSKALDYSKQTVSWQAHVLRNDFDEGNGSHLDELEDAGAAHLKTCGNDNNCSSKGQGTCVRHTKGKFFNDSRVSCWESSECLGVGDRTCSNVIKYCSVWILTKFANGQEGKFNAATHISEKEYEVSDLSGYQVTNNATDHRISSFSATKFRVKTNMDDGEPGNSINHLEKVVGGLQNIDQVRAQTSNK